MNQGNSISQLITEAKAAYQAGYYQGSAELFASAANEYTAMGDGLAAAEMANNQSVALLKAGQNDAAWTVVDGTDLVFANAGDRRRQALALGNQAAALESLGRSKQAIERYERSADLLKAIGENELRSITLQSLSALQLKDRRQFEAMATMQTALASKKHLNAKEHVLKRLLRVAFQLLHRS
jgi:tetratricopeptide (TPR) repeat protein